MGYASWAAQHLGIRCVRHEVAHLGMGTHACVGGYGYSCDGGADVFFTDRRVITCLEGKFPYWLAKRHARK